GNERTGAGGESHLIRRTFMVGKEYVHLLFEARWLRRKVECKTNSHILTINSGLMISNTNTNKMKRLLDSIDAFHLDHELLQGNIAKERYPQHRLFPEDIMVLDKNAGFLRPELAVVLAVKRAEDLGADIKRYTTVQHIYPNRESVT